MKSSLKVHLSNTNTFKSDLSGSTSLTDAGRIQERTVGGKDVENSRLRPAVNHDVPEFSPGSKQSRQVSKAEPAATTSTGNAYLKTHSKNGISPVRKSVTQPDSLDVRKPDQATWKKTNSASSLPKSNTDTSRTASSSKVQDALNRLKKKSVLDETGKREASKMLRGQGIGALTAKFESPKESKLDKPTTRRDPIITSKVSARKEIFNNGIADSSSSSGKSSPRSVVERYTSPGKSASLKSKFESKPEADRQPQFIRKPKGETVNEGDSVKFSCKASGVPYPSVSWQFKGKTLKDEGRFEIYTEKDIHYLEIFDLVADDAGLYSCKLLNSTGRASASAELTVTGKLTIYSCTFQLICEAFKHRFYSAVKKQQQQEKKRNLKRTLRTN